jgi:outer membrane protein TolC
MTACGVACGLSTVLLTGCVVGPKYRQPVINVPPFHNAPAVQARKTNVAAPGLDRWWTGFQDPELTKIVQRAVEQNLDLAASLSRVEQARAAAKQAGARLKPSGSLIAQSTSYRQSLESPVGQLANAFPELTEIKPFWTWELQRLGKSTCLAE